jgi:uncharacterized membrane protein
MDGRYLALLSAFFFGLGPVILALGYRRTSSAELAILVSMLVGLPLLILIAPMLGGVQLAGLGLTTIFLFAIGGLLGPLMGRGFLYLGIERLGSSRAFTIQHTAPLITAIAAVFILAESVAAGQWFAILIIIGGMAIVGRQSRTAIPESVRISGLMFAMLAAISFGLRPVIFKMGFQESPDPMTASIVGAAAAFIALLVFLASTGRMRKLRFDRRSLLLFGIVGILNNLGFLVVNFSFNAGDVSIVYPINSIAPLITFGLSFLILQNVERLSWKDLVGTLGVVAGVVLLFV